MQPLPTSPVTPCLPPVGAHSWVATAEHPQPHLMPLWGPECYHPEGNRGCPPQKGERGWPTSTPIAPGPGNLHVPSLTQKGRGGKAWVQGWALEDAHGSVTSALCRDLGQVPSPPSAALLGPLCQSGSVSPIFARPGRAVGVWVCSDLGQCLDRPPSLKATDTAGSDRRGCRPSSGTSQPSNLQGAPPPVTTERSPPLPKAAARAPSAQ